VHFRSCHLRSEAIAVSVTRTARGTVEVDIRMPHDGRWLVVREDVDAPKGRDFDVRGPGLWLSLVCETPGEHWTIGLEAFALAVDDPDDERGDLVALGLDVEWEAPGRVHGEVLVADARWDVDEPGELTIAA
jgi:hypothetical protein